MNRVFVLILWCCLCCCCSCKKTCDFSSVPTLEYIDFVKIPNGSGIDEKGTLKLAFTDAEGDIGYAGGDTLPPFGANDEYHYNFFIDYYEKQKGNYVKI